MRCFLWLLGFLLCGAVYLAADAPPVPPGGNRTACSLNGTHCAFSLFEAKRLEVWKVAKGSRHQKLEMLYAMDGWFPNVSVSNDGQNVIVANKDGNLLEPGYKFDQVILSFYHLGKKMRDVPLNELVRNPSSLERTESHYRWCRSYGLDQTGIYVVNTMDNRHLAFDPNSGKLLN